MENDFNHKLHAPNLFSLSYTSLLEPKMIIHILLLFVLLISVYVGGGRSALLKV